MSHPAVITTMPAQAPAGYTLSAVPPDTVTSPKTRPCFQLRLVTAVLQTLLGVTAMVCGVVVVVLRYPDDDTNYAYRDDDNFFEYESATRDRLDGGEGWFIGLAIFMVLTSCFGVYSKRNQTLISLYMALSIIAALATFIGTLVTAGYVSRTNEFMRDLQRGLRRGGSYSGYNSHRVCRLNDYPRDQSETDSPLILERYYGCLREYLGAARTHLSCWFVILTCFILEFFAAIVAASSTCSGLDCCRKTRQQSQTMVYHIPQTTAQVVPQQLIFQQMNQPRGMSPQVIVPAEPPPPYTVNTSPPYTSLIHEPTVNRPTNVTPATPAASPAALTAPSARPSQAGDASPQPVVPGRRMPTSPLPIPPNQSVSDPAYLEPSNGVIQQGDVSMYSTPDDGGPPQGESSYLTPNAQRPPHYSSYVVSNDGSRPPQDGNTYLEPNPMRPIQGDRNEAFQYDYADPIEEERQRHRAGQNIDDEYVEVIP